MTRSPPLPVIATTLPSFSNLGVVGGLCDRRKGIGIVFGLAIAFTATTFISSFFNLTSGAAF